MNVKSSSRWRAASSRWAHRARVVETMVLLVAATAAQRWVPMTRWSRLIGDVGAVPTKWRGERIEVLPPRWATASERKVVRAVEAAARRVPFTPTCLAEATAGQIMLRQLGSPGVVVIGIRASDAAPAGPWDAHAWLLGRHGALTGGRAARGFTATTVFEVEGGLVAHEVHLSPGRPNPSPTSTRGPIGDGA